MAHDAAKDSALAHSLATPPGKPAGLAGAFTWRTLPLLAARFGIFFARARLKPVRIGKSTVIAIRHRHVNEVLERDLDYLVEPVYGARFDEIGYRFVLGMDRNAAMVAERRALYGALQAVDMAPVRAATDARIAEALDGCRAIDVVEDYARPIAAATAMALFGIAPDDRAAFMNAARAIFQHGFLNLNNDPAVVARATAAAHQLDGWFDAEIGRRRAARAPGCDMMGQLIAQGADDDLVRRTLGGMLVGSIDTTATVVAKVMSELMRDRQLLRRVRRDCGNDARMWGWCQDILRRWPQTPLLLRVAAGPTDISGVAVPAGARVFLWTQAAMFDASAFPTPLAMRPTRAEAPYLHLGGGLHPCAGRAINAWQIARLVGALVERRPASVGRMEWAGPFPAHLRLVMEGKRA